MVSIDEAVRDFKNGELSPYCLDHCNSKCCRFDQEYIIRLNSAEVDLVIRAGIAHSTSYAFKVALSGVFGNVDLEKMAEDVLIKKKEGLQWKGELESEGTNRLYAFPEDWHYYLKTTCPALDCKSKHCRIHDSPDRPEACENFPVSLNKYKGIVLDELCPYVKEHRCGIIAYFEERCGEELAAMERTFTIFLPDRRTLILPKKAHDDFFESQRVMQDFLQALSGTMGGGFVPLR